MSKVCEMAKEALTPIVTALGMEIIDIEYKKSYDSMHLTIYIDKDGGISLDDCETVHRAIDEPLEALDPTAGSPFVLNVSSPGIDRPLKTNSDLTKKIGQDVEVSLYTLVEKKKKFEGALVAFDDETLTINYQNKELILQRKNIAVVKPAIKF